MMRTTAVLRVFEQEMRRCLWLIAALAIAIYTSVGVLLGALPTGGWWPAVGVLAIGWAFLRRRPGAASSPSAHGSSNSPSCDVEAHPGASVERVESVAANGVGGTGATTGSPIVGLVVGSVAWLGLLILLVPFTAMVAMWADNLIAPARILDGLMLAGVMVLVYLHAVDAGRAAGLLVEQSGSPVVDSART